MTSLQSILSQRQKEQSTAAVPTNIPEKRDMRRADTQVRAEWLKRLFPNETADTRNHFAASFETEGDMQSRALELKRMQRDLKSDVADWSYVESKHQSLKSKSKKPEEPKPPVEEEKKPSPATIPPPQAHHFYERRGSRGYRRGFQGRGGYRRNSPRSTVQSRPLPQSEVTAEPPSMPVELPSVPPMVASEPAVLVSPPVAPPQPVPTVDLKTDPEPTPVQTEVVTPPVVQPAAKPFAKPRPAYSGGKKWVKKAAPQVSAPVQEATVETPPAVVDKTGVKTESSCKPMGKPDDVVVHVDEVSLKEAEAKAHKMTLDLVHSDESSEHSHSKNIAVQTEFRSLTVETQTDEELIWRNGIPCMLVPLSAVPGYAMQVGVLGNPGKLFG